MNPLWSENGLGPGGYLLLVLVLIVIVVLFTRRSRQTKKSNQKLEIDRLIHHLQHEDVDRREKAIQQLVEVGAPAVQPLLHLVNTTGSTHAVIAVCRILDALKDPAQYQQVMEAFRKSPEDLYLRPDFRKQVVKSLANIGKPIQESLFNLIEQRDAKGVFSCALKGLLEMEDLIEYPEALDRLINALIPALRDPDPRIRQSAMGALDRIWHQVKDANHQRRILAAIYRSLQDDSVWVRRNAVILLEEIRATLRGNMPHVQIIYAMTAALADADAYVRRDAFNSLQKQRKWLPILVRGGRSLNLIDALFALLKDPDLKQSAALLLFEMGYPKPLDELERQQEVQDRFKSGVATSAPSHLVGRGTAEIYRALKTAAPVHQTEPSPSLRTTPEDFYKNALDQSEHPDTLPNETKEQKNQKSSPQNTKKP